MFTLTAKCAVATPVAATRKSARAPRARGASSDPADARATRWRDGCRRDGARGGLNARVGGRARVDGKGRISSRAMGARGSGRARRGGVARAYMREVGGADETLKPELARGGERDGRGGRPCGRSDASVRSTRR